MQRILSLDLARGFTVLFIPIVHSVMVYGNAETHDSAFGRVLSFIAEWPGAQIFMIIMGICFELSKPKTFRVVFIRSLALLILGYSLNFLKFILPYFFGGIPGELLSDLNANSWHSLLLIGDILQFAGISLIILWIIQQARDRALVALLIMMFVCFATPVPTTANLHVVELAVGGPPRVFFPLFPWLVYPLAGLVIGHSLKEYKTKVVFMTLAIIGAGLMLSSFCATRTFNIQNSPSFYVTNCWDTLMHLGFAIAWISLWNFTTRIKANCTNAFIRVGRYIVRFLEFLSKRITIIYLIQWPVIFWLLPVIGYRTLGAWPAAVIGIDVTLLTLLITLIVEYHIKVYFRKPPD